MAVDRLLKISDIKKTYGIDRRAIMNAVGNGLSFVDFGGGQKQVYYHFRTSDIEALIEKNTRFAPRKLQ